MVGKSGSIFNRINDITNSQDKTINRLATGKRIATASDDPAGLAISMGMEAQTRGLARQITNRQDEISLMQVAEGGMSGISDAVQRMRELSIQSANGTLTASDREAIQVEIDQLNQHIDQTANNTEFNTKKILDGSLKMTLQNGNDFSIPNMDSTSLGVSLIDLSTQESAQTIEHIDQGLPHEDDTAQENAQAAIGYADQALSKLNSARTEIGAVTNGISAEVNSLTQEMVNTLSANSRLADADFAAEIVNLTKAKITLEAATQVFKIDNAMKGQVLRLLA